jgi:CheY-like chemotaxis protein
MSWNTDTLPRIVPSSVIAALREDAERRSFVMPATILVTGVDVERAREAGADVVLRKPFQLPDLETLLRRFLGAPGAKANAEALTPDE